MCTVLLLLLLLLLLPLLLLELLLVHELPVLPLVLDTSLKITPLYCPLCTVRFYNNVYVLAVLFTNSI